ncbi:unnamed protein product, partial [marine sediment metagenome]
MSEEDKEKKEDLSEIDLTKFLSGFGDSLRPPGTEPGKEGEAPPGDEGKEEPTEPGYTEVSLSTQMLIGMIGFALSMRYLPDKKAVKAFNEKYRTELPKVIESFGMQEVFDQICATTLTFKIKESDTFNVPLPGWVGLVAVLGVLIVAGLFIKVDTIKKPKLHVDRRGGKKHG